MTYKPKEKILTEGELCKWWGLTSEQLDELRRRRALPHIVINRSTRLYRESSLITWLSVHEAYPISGSELKPIESLLKTSETG